MAVERLFGAKIRPACKYCEYILGPSGDGNVICEKRGSVLLTHKCRLFVYDPLRRVPHKPRPLQKIDDSEFEL